MTINSGNDKQDDNGLEFARELNLLRQDILREKHRKAKKLPDRVTGVLGVALIFVGVSVLFWGGFPDPWEWTYMMSACVCVQLCASGLLLISRVWVLWPWAIWWLLWLPALAAATQEWGPGENFPQKVHNFIRFYGVWAAPLVSVYSIKYWGRIQIFVRSLR